MALNIRKAFINARRVNSAKFGYEAHFMSFAAIVASRNGTEGSDFHIGTTNTGTDSFSILKLYTFLKLLQMLLN
jgi:hypothetical protein